MFYPWMDQGGFSAEADDDEVKPTVRPTVPSDIDVFARAKQEIMDAQIHVSALLRYLVDSSY